MFDLTTLDYIYIAVILSSTVWATIRGGVYETVATISWIVAALVSRFVSPHLDTMFQNWFGLSESTIGTLIAAYFLVFFVILVLFSLVNHKLRDRVQESMLKITDHTLGVIFGILRGIVAMGIIYWGALWYYSDSKLPAYIETARIRPVMQLTALKIHDWFLPTPNKLIERDMRGAVEAEEIYNNLINPKVDNHKELNAEKSQKNENTTETDTNVNAPETGYKSSERTSLENQLLQIENTAVTNP